VAIGGQGWASHCGLHVAGVQKQELLWRIEEFRSGAGQWRVLRVKTPPSAMRAGFGGAGV